MWTISKLSGSRAQLKDKISTLKDLPEEAKAFVSAQVDSLPADCVSAVVDAFGQDIRNPANLTTTRNVQITVRGIHG